jgi:hypothetical protein
MKTFPDFGKELRRPFEVDQRCFDCAELYHGCKGTPENPDMRCADALRLPDVKAGTTGQVIPPSRMGDRKEPRVRGETASAAPGKPATSVPAKVPEQNKGDARDLVGKPAANTSGQSTGSVKTANRVCGCGAPLPKGRRLCDACRTQNRRQTRRDYMRSYMEQRRSPTSGSDPDVPSTHTATHSTQAGGEDRASTGLRPGVPPIPQTTVLTNAFQGAFRIWHENDNKETIRRP